MFEELYASALDPVSADRSENAGSLGGNIVIEEGVGEMSYSQPRAAHGMP
jgi:urocanate hydratase